MIRQKVHFEKISNFPRQEEPFSLPVPFARGTLVDAGLLRLIDGAEELPLQCRVTSTWPDGSVRWALLQSQADLPGNDSKVIFLDAGSSTAHPAPPSPVSLTEEDGGWKLDTGPLQIGIGCGGRLIGDIRLDDVDLPWQAVAFELTLADGGLFTAGTVGAAVKLLENGPLRARLALEGSFLDAAGKPLCSSHLVLTAYAGKAWLQLEHQLIQDSSADMEVASLRLRLERPAPERARLLLGEGCYFTEIEEADDRLYRLLDEEAVLYLPSEHMPEVFFGDFWADHTGAEGGLQLSLYQAHQNFPKALETAPDGLTAWLLPQEGPALRWPRGVAKTHTVQLHFHSADTERAELSRRSLQFQMPDMPRLYAEVFQQAGVWPETFPRTLSPSLERLLWRGVDNRSTALGIFHFGDAPDPGYSGQGRGRERLVWTNNEYDLPHAMFLQWARGGERRPFSVALAAARHWMDVDLCHASDDPLCLKGMVMHSPGHVDGKVLLSHQWVEGLLDIYHLTGSDEALERAVGIGENILRNLEAGYKDMATFPVRETGWAMRALVALYREDSAERWIEPCHYIFEQFLAREKEYGSLISPYTDHAMARVPFMSAIAVSALAVYYKTVQREGVVELLLRELDDLLENSLRSDGLFYYKELPSLQRRFYGLQHLEALAWGHQLSGDVHYLRAGLPTLKECLLHPPFMASGFKAMAKMPAEGGIVIGYGTLPGPKIFAEDFRPLLAFYNSLAEADMLSRLEDILKGV